MIVGNIFAVEAARVATAAIPIVFVPASDPVKRASSPASTGRVATAITGVSFTSNLLKRQTAAVVA